MGINKALNRIQGAQTKFVTLTLAFVLIASIVLVNHSPAYASYLELPAPIVPAPAGNESDFENVKIIHVAGPETLIFSPPPIPGANPAFPKVIPVIRMRDQTDAATFTEVTIQNMGGNFEFTAPQSLFSGNVQLGGAAGPLLQDDGSGGLAVGGVTTSSVTLNNPTGGGGAGNPVVQAVNDVNGNRTVNINAQLAVETATDPSQVPTLGQVNALLAGSGIASASANGEIIILGANSNAVALDTATLGLGAGTKTATMESGLPHWEINFAANTITVGTSTFTGGVYNVGTGLITTPVEIAFAGIVYGIDNTTDPNNPVIAFQRSGTDPFAGLDLDFQIKVSEQ